MGLKIIQWGSTGSSNEAADLSIMLPLSFSTSNCATVTGTNCYWSNKPSTRMPTIQKQFISFRVDAGVYYICVIAIGF